MRNEKSKNERLLSCPFCGGEAEPSLTDWKFAVRCKRCKATVSREYSEVNGAEVLKWNTRKQMQEIVKKLEEWKNSSQDSLEKCAFEKAIEIVKRGGVDEQID